MNVECVLFLSRFLKQHIKSFRKLIKQNYIIYGQNEHNHDTNGLVITLSNGLTLSDLYEMTSQILSHAHTGKSGKTRKQPIIWFRTAIFKKVINLYTRI